MNPSVPRRPEVFWQQWQDLPPEARHALAERLRKWPKPLWQAGATLGPDVLGDLGLDEDALVHHARTLVASNDPQLWADVHRLSPRLIAGWHRNVRYVWREITHKLVQCRAVALLEGLVTQGWLRPQDADDPRTSSLAWRAASSGWVEGLECLHRHGLTGLERYEKGRILAHACVYGPHPGILDMMARWNVPVRTKDDKGVDALYRWGVFLQQQGLDRKPVVQVPSDWLMSLLRHGFDPHAPTGKTARSRSFLEWARGPNHIASAKEFWAEAAQILQVQQVQLALEDAVPLASPGTTAPVRRRI